MNAAGFFPVKTRLRLTAVALLLAAITGLLIHGRLSKSGGPVVDRVARYDEEEVVRFLGQRQVEIGYYFNMRRDADGSRLYISPYTDDSVTNRVIIVSESGIESLDAPGRTVFLNHQNEFVAWTDDFTRGIKFKDGYMLKLPKFALFDIDPSGEYFVVGEKPNSAWLGKVGDPGNRTLISRALLADRVFVKAERIYVCGSLYKRSPASGAIADVAACLILSATDRTYIVEAQIELPWAGGILDVDPHSDRFLIQGRSDYFTRDHLYDLRTRGRRSIGWAKNWGFFLANDFLKVSNNRQNQEFQKR